MTEPKQKSIKELIANSSIGRGLADIKERGIDAHLVDLEEEMKRPWQRGDRGEKAMRAKRKRGGDKRSAAARKRKKDPGLGSGSEQPPKVKYNTSLINLPGGYTFVADNRKMMPPFHAWWDALLKKIPDGDPLPNIEIAHKAYMAGSSIGTHAAYIAGLKIADDGGWYVKDVINRVGDISAHRLIIHKKQNEISLECGVGSAVRDRIERENKAIGDELARRRQLDVDSLLREERARAEVDRQYRAQHTCVKDGTSKGCRACDRGVPYPHPEISELLDGARGKKLSVLVDIVRRLESEMGRLRIELDRLARID